MGSKYVMIKNQTMMAIHIAVFVRKELQPLLSEVFSCNVATGFADRVGNKGSVSISFSIRGTTLLFINSHLPAHQGKIEDRNNSYHRIMAETKFRKEASTPTTPSNVAKEENRTPITPYPIQEQFRVIFFMGDMNYRVNGNRRVVDKLIETKMIDVLLANDQLSIERNRGNVFNGFTEGEISFFPTYKFSKNSDIYDDSKKQRIPAWTDRILWSSKDSVELIEYNSMKTVRMSDHRPVYGCFLVKLDADPNELVLDDVQETTTAQSNVCTIQ
jgi:phosphatidylinositol-bisphosphatase